MPTKGHIRNTKLIRAVRLLSPDERRQFRDFAHSPYFNKHDKVQLLSDLITDDSVLNKADDWTKHDIARHLFPGEVFHEQRVSDVMTYTYRLLSTFLQQQAFEGDKMTAHYCKSHAYREKGFDKEFLRIINQSPLRLDQDALTPEDFLYSYQIEGEADQFHLARDSRTKDKSIERKTRALDLFFLSEKLYNTCEMLNRQNIVNVEFAIDMVEEVQQYIDNHFDDVSCYPYIAIYYHVLQTLRDPEEEDHYQRLVQLLETYNQKFDQEELRRMYDYAENYCIKKINQGQNDYLNEIFKLYKQLLQTGVILQDGLLTEGDFKNIVTVGTRLGAFDWTEQFIYNYQYYLPQEARENAFTYNLATLYYAQERYDDALPLLQTVEFNNVVYNLGARSMLLKIYYDQEEYDPLFSLIDSFDSYLRRNQTLSNYQYLAHKNLLKLVKRLANLRIRQVSSRKKTLQKDLQALQKRIQATEEIVNLKWLEEKVEEMEKNITGYAKAQS